MHRFNVKPSLGHLLKKTEKTLRTERAVMQFRCKRANVKIKKNFLGMSPDLCDNKIPLKGSSATPLAADGTKLAFKG